MLGSVHAVATSFAPEDFFLNPNIMLPSQNQVNIQKVFKEQEENMYRAALLLLLSKVTVGELNRAGPGNNLQRSHRTSENIKTPPGAIQE